MVKLRVSIVLGLAVVACSSDPGGDAGTGDTSTPTTETGTTTSATLTGEASSIPDTGTSVGSSSGALDSSSGGDSSGESTGGGASSCADYLFCEDFERGSPGEIPPGWAEHWGWDSSGSRAVLTALQQSASNARGLTRVGALLVLAAAEMLLLTLENALNQMWGVKTPRPLLRRTGLVVLLLAVGPLLVGAGLWASASLIGASMGLVRHTPPWLAFGLELGPVVLCSAALAITLRVLPHAPVRWRHAVVAGVLGGIALELGKRAFAAYLIHGPIYQSLYGALATLPVFLLWVYFSCVVALSAALVAAQLGRGAGARSRAARGGGAARLARARA